MIFNDLISVIIPIKNRASIIAKTLKSVLNQSYENWEVIVVDDGSNDSNDLKAEIDKISDCRIKLLKVDKVKNAAYARNFGAQQSLGEYIAFLDSDDEWLSSHLIECINSINEGECQFGAFINRNGKFDNPTAFSFGGRYLLHKLFTQRSIDFRTSTLFFRKSIFDAIRFDENLEKHQDWGLAVDFSYQHQFFFREKPTVIINTNSSDRMSNKVNAKASQYFARTKLSGSLKSEFIASRMTDELAFGTLQGFKSYLNTYCGNPNTLKKNTRVKLFFFRIVGKNSALFYFLKFGLKLYRFIKIPLKKKSPD